MKELSGLSSRERESLRAELERRLGEIRRKKLALDMTRGKPGPDQLDLSAGLLTILGEEDYLTDGGLDTRNYGGLDGFAEAKKLFADFLEVAPGELIVGGNSSLQLMFDAVSQCVTHGTAAGAPWFGRKTRFLCPVPGYDRHFAICEHFGIEMLPVPTDEHGPLMEGAEQRAAEDPAVKGIWCVPKYSNPTGAVFSEEVVERLAAMRTAAPDFRIFWDNAYCVHHLGGGPAPLPNILSACRRAGCPDRVLLFGSTSKVSFPGAGVAVMGGSENNMAWARRRLSCQTIGPDKINLLRHLRFFGSLEGILAHMERHARLLAPKFAAVQEVLTRELGGRGVARWTEPRGGYFVSLDTLPGRASRVVALASELGVKLTAAGATWPYGKDPRDTNIRIAPTLPSLEQIRSAMEVLATCILWVSLEGA
jgi:DNA-binding transcriptional MocR family regulator